MKTDNTDYIYITSNYWDHEYTDVFSYSDSIIKHAIEHNEIYENKLLSDEFIYDRKVMSKNALEYLSDYIQSNCLDKPKEMTRHCPLYTLVIKNREGTFKCYNYATDPDKTVHYFKDMIKYLEKSKYKAEYSELIISLNEIIHIVSGKQKI